VQQLPPPWAYFQLLCLSWRRNGREVNRGGSGSTKEFEIRGERKISGKGIDYEGIELEGFQENLSFSFKDMNSCAFIAHIDPSSIIPADSDATATHANLATINLNTVETIEYEGWLACLEEPIASIDWTQHNNNVDPSSIMIAQHTRIKSLNTCPFYLDLGASVHISPDSSDFFSLHPITSRAIKGVGGSSIM
jgi:hypothetical protein